MNAIPAVSVTGDDASDHKCCYRCLMMNAIPAVSVTGDDASDHKCCYRHLFERLDGRIRGNLRQEAIDRFSKPGKMFVCFSRPNAMNSKRSLSPLTDSPKQVKCCFSKPNAMNGKWSLSPFTRLPSQPIKG